MQTAATEQEGKASSLSLLSVGVLSFGAPQTIKRALELHTKAGLTKLPAEFFVYFNALSAEDEELAKAAGVSYYGSPQNTGIYGGFRAIAETAKHPYILILENDIVPLDGVDLGACLESCLSDMREHGIRIFCLRSRAFPGQGNTSRKYARCLPVIDPINPEQAPSEPSIASRFSMLMAHGYFSKFYGAAIYFEKSPEIAQPRAIRKLPSGNYVTDSRFRNWSNQSVLVERDYFLNTICRRVEEKPDPRLVHGFQDIERALNSWWWRRQREPMGHAAQGVFTHARLDR
jgi:hypothetical protein